MSEDAFVRLSLCSFLIMGGNDIMLFMFQQDGVL